MNKVIDVTVIIASYCPAYEKLLSTINSIINQIDINVEIVISDDCSENNYFDELQAYFGLVHFNEYKFLEHKQNVGTCQNIYDALKISKGEFVKTISPGDYLYSSETLNKWITFMRQNHDDISFGKIVNYHMDIDSKVVIDRVLKQPQLIEYYSAKCFNQARECYLLLSDIPCGASFVGRKDVLLEYLEKIVGKVRYAEDFSVKLMLLDGIILSFFDENVVWYEYGTGISTSKSDKWAKLLAEDLGAIHDIMISRRGLYSGFSARFVEYLMKCKQMKKENSYLKYLYFPEVLPKVIMKKLSKKYTDDIQDIDKFYKITKADEEFNNAGN